MLRVRRSVRMARVRVAHWTCLEEDACHGRNVSMSGMGFEGMRTFFEVAVACARKKKLANVKEVER